jgi:simple sugar transport system substrate-binding protein/ribose transport system substrate-binding protein
MKKLFLLLVASSMVTLIGGCNKTASGGSKSDNIVIAGIVFQDDQSMKMRTEGYIQAAKDNGVEIMTANSENDQAREAELINTYIEQGVKGLAVDPLNAVASIAALRAAHDKGIEIAVVDQTFDNADFIVGGFCSNNYDNTYAVGTEAAKLIKQIYGDKTINLAIIQFKSQLPDLSTERVKGYTDALKAGGIKYTVVADQDAWTQDMSVAASDAIMTAHPELDVFICMNEGGTIGTAMNVANVGKGDKIKVFGHDSSDQITAMILDPSNPLQAVVAQDPFNEGYNAVSALVKAIRGEDVPTRGKFTFLPGVVLSISDTAAVDAYRVQQGY